MASKSSNENYQLVWLVRRLFRALAQKSSDNLDRYNLTVADRAVMEFLYPQEQLSVPGIAARYQVSRQHVQVTVNSLRKKGLLESLPNPRHKRSSLIQLSDKGGELFANILEKDKQTVEKLFLKSRWMIAKPLAALLNPYLENYLRENDMNQNRLTLNMSRPALLIREKILHYRPPRISMLLLALAAALQWVLPPVRVELFSSPLLAVCAAAPGFIIMMWAWWLFQKAETAICPTADSRVIVTSGIYRFTRNPMYLGMVLMMAGMALWFGTLPFYLVTVLYFLMINHVFCQFEEEQLSAAFGKEFSDYQRKVRRWI